MIAMHEAMAHYYNYVLKAIEQAEPALKYLYSRGFTDEQIAREKIGYSPNVSTFTRDYLKNKGYDEALAYDAGLLSRNEETISYFDRFRNRIMFPIKDFRGKVIGFSARSIDGSEPKYLNSPETLIFQKEMYFIILMLQENQFVIKMKLFCWKDLWMSLSLMKLEY